MDLILVNHKIQQVTSSKCAEKNTDAMCASSLDQKVNIILMLLSRLIRNDLYVSKYSDMLEMRPGRRGTHGHTKCFGLYLHGDFFLDPKCETEQN